MTNKNVKKSSKRNARKSTNGKTNKSEFVRGFAQGTPAQDIVDAAKKQGIKLSARYVYVIRSADKTRGRDANGTGRRARNGNAESELRSAIAEIGLGRARQVLAEVEKAFGS